MRGAALGLAALVALASPARGGEVVRDGSIGGAGAILPDGDTFFIDESHGEVRGGVNLFFSFDQFNLDLGEIAEFSGSATIENVLARVTGGPSLIDGTIQTPIDSVFQPQRFLFLNPNGISFGPGASIDMNAAFHASTGDSVTLAGGDVFPAGSADPLPGDPLLFTGSPVDFGFLGAGPEKRITVEGALTGEGTFADLALIGAGIELDGATIAAGFRHLNLISVGGPGAVGLTSTGFNDVSSFAQLGPISLAGSTVFTLGDIETSTSADLVIRARTLELLDVSALGTGALGGGGLIDVFAADSVFVGPGSSISTATAGNSGDLLIETSKLVLDGGLLSTAAQPLSSTGFGTDAGDVVLLLDSLEMDGGAEIRADSVLGDAGDILAIGRDSIAIDSSELRASSLQGGQSGDVLLLTPNLSISGSSFVTSAGNGDGGDVIFASAVPPPDLSPSKPRGGGLADELKPKLPDLLGPGTLSLVDVSVDTSGGVEGGVPGEFLILGFEEPPDGGGGPPGGFPPETGDGDGDGGGLPGEEGEGEREARQFAVPRPPYRPAPPYPKTCSAARVDLAASGRGLAASPEGLLQAFDVLGDSEVALGPEGPELPPVAPAPGPLGLARAVTFEGAEAFRTGDFERAERRWRDAAEAYGAAGERALRADALRGLAQAQQALGYYLDSISTLEAARELLDGVETGARIASVHGGIGSAQLALGAHGSARRELERALAAARSTGDDEVTAAVLTNLGNEYATRGEHARALGAYEEAAGLASGIGHRAHRAKALANGARAAVLAGRPERAAELLALGGAAGEALPDTEHKAYVLIHLGRSHAMLASASAAHRDAGLLAAHALHSTASGFAGVRAESYSLGNLAALYRSENRTEEALALTRRAIALAERSGASDSLYRWHRQEAELLWEAGRANDALHAYRRAVEILQESRPEARGKYGSSEAYFRTQVAPVYLGLADVLLRGSELVADADARDRLLREARDVVEQLKAAELRDYYRDECIADVKPAEKTLDEIAGDAAVVYPILLPDRLELLVSLPSGLRRYTQPVTADAVRAKVGELRAVLQQVSTNRYLGPSRELYAWLVEPYAAELAASGVETLVFVPDGPLRTIPMTVLHDGESFLIDRYAVAVAPALKLLGPEPLEPAPRRVLLGGVSEPVQDFPALPNVEGELAEIQGVFGGAGVLLDSQFTLDRIAGEVETVDPKVVHFATHAVFTGDPATTFLLAHDRKVGMEQLSDLVGMERPLREPIELVVLSACNTAEGDERAGLGLSGVAIRAGARSAVGSLWVAHDEAAKELMVEFYRQLADPQVNKAVALQRAQAKLRSGGRFRHPFYWSPFLVINNWL